jgi:16S rRNA (guanine527-N7)-methyltransferase
MCADVVSARALAPLPALLGLAAPHLAPDGEALFPKGAGAAAEIAAARALWRFKLEHIPSITDATASLLRIGDLQRV